MTHVEAAQKVAKILDMKTVFTLGAMLVTVAAAWATMSTKIDRFNEDLREVKYQYAQADSRMQNQIDDVSGALALQAVSLGKIEAGITYIQRSVDSLQKVTTP